MGINPEQVLVEERVAALCGVENADAEKPLHDHEEHGDADDRGREDLHPCGGVEAPHRKRHFKEAHAGRAQLMDGGDDVDAR